MRSLFLFVCVTRSTGYWPDLRSPLVERPTPAAAACMSRRDWAQRALGFAAVAGAALPARADEIDDAFSRILSSAAEEMGQFDAGSDGQRKVAERTLEKLRAATVLQVQQEAAPAVSAPVGIAPTEAVFGANTMGETSAFSTAAPPAAAPAALCFGGSPSTSAPSVNTFAPAPAPAVITPAETAPAAPAPVAAAARVEEEPALAATAVGERQQLRQSRGPGLSTALAAGATVACSLGWLQSMLRDENTERLLEKLSELGAAALEGRVEQDEYLPEQLVRVAPTTAPTVIEFELASVGS